MEEEPEECEEGLPAWMGTFSDMATLLLTFFVLLLSFANMDVVQFRTMMGSVREAFGVQFEEPGDFQARSSSPVSLSMGGSPQNPSVLEQAPTIQRLRRRLQDEGLTGVVEVEGSPRGVTLRIRDGVLFGSGSAALIPDALSTLTHLGEISNEFTRELSIEGHTDDRPINTGRYPSNWELSASRATAVLRHLESVGGGAEQMSIAGYAATRPVAANDSDAGRSRNRRVEFVFIRLEESEVEAAAEAQEAEPAAEASSQAPAEEEEDRAG